jgi:hypothetical protein
MTTTTTKREKHGNVNERAQSQQVPKTAGVTKGSSMNDAIAKKMQSSVECRYVRQWIDCIDPFHHKMER